MPQSLATAFELGDRAFGRAWYAFAVFGEVAVARGDVHHFQHVLGVRFPVGGHVQDAANLQLAAHQFGEGRLNDATLVVTALVPRVREEQHQSIEAVVGDAAVEHFNACHRLQPDNWTYKRQAWSLFGQDRIGGDFGRFVQGPIQGEEDAWPFDSDFRSEVSSRAVGSYYPKTM